jgi:hypothetical protein
MPDINETVMLTNNQIDEKQVNNDFIFCTEELELEEEEDLLPFVWIGNRRKRCRIFAMLHTHLKCIMRQLL